MPQKAKGRATTKKTASVRVDAKSFSILDLVKELNSFSVDNYWDLGRFLVDKVMPLARKQGMFEEQVLKMVSNHPGIKFPFSMLKQCQQYYSYYPDVKKRPLAEVFYFDLATKVDETKRRDQYEKMAMDARWTITDLRKKIHDDNLARRMDERTKYGFDLRERNGWTLETPDPRFGRPNFKGRLPGQIVANALFYYTKPGDYIVDPFAGSGTTGDVVEAVPTFNDRKVKMYDSEPVSEGIARNNILHTGIPEQSDSVDYIFLDPPAEYTQKDASADFGMGIEAIKADFILKFKGIVRECTRILKTNGRVSIVIEPSIAVGEFIDFPSEVSGLFKDAGFKQVGKVYLPRRSSEGTKGTQTIDEMRGIRLVSSDCREMLTYQKN